MRILYLSRSRLTSPLNAVCLEGLRAKGMAVDAFFVPVLRWKELVKIWRHYWRQQSEIGFILVGWDSSGLVILSRFFFRRPVVYHATLPAYERMITSRGLTSPWSLKALYYWLVDWLAFVCSDLITLESNQQIAFVNRFYRIDRRRLWRLWVGVREEDFFYDPALLKFSRFTVVFRGAFLPEAGAEYAIEAAKILEDENIQFIIIGQGPRLEKVQELIKKWQPVNLRLITDLVLQAELRKIMQQSHLSLGQLSDHPRLARTIPCKAYESLALKLPYLTAANSGILELLTPDQTCLTCRPADAVSLAQKILWVRNHYSLAEKIAENGYQFFQKELRSEILAKNLWERMTSSF